MSKLRKALGIIPKNIEKHEFLLSEGFKLSCEGDSQYYFNGKINNVHFRIFIWDNSIRVIHSIWNEETHQDFKYTDDTWDEVYNDMLDYVSTFKYIRR